MTLLYTLFLLIISFSTLNFLNLNNIRVVFSYVIPFAVCSCISNINLWHSLKNGMNQRNGFTKYLRFAMILIFVIIIFVFGLGFLYLLGLIELETINNKGKILYFGIKNSGNLAIFDKSFIPWFSVIYYASTQPLLHLIQMFIGLLEFGYYKREEKEANKRKEKEAKLNEKDKE